MSIPTDPSCTEIAEEFGSSTRQDVYGSTLINLYKLKEMYNTIFGTTNPHSRTIFGGYGKPEVTLDGATIIDRRFIEVNYTVNSVNNTFARVGLKYTTDSAFNSGIVDLGTQQNNSAGSYSISTGQLDYSTTYYYRIYYYNDFNYIAADHLELPSPPSNPASITTESEPTLTAPVIVDVDMVLVSGQKYRLIVKFSVGPVEPDTYTGRYELNNNGINGANLSNLNTTGAEYTVEYDDTGLLFSGGETTYVELTANKSGYQPTTGTYTYTAAALEPPQNLSLSQNDTSKGILTATWTQGELGSSSPMTILWYRNYLLDNTTTLSSGTTSQTRTFSHDDNVYFRIKYNEGLDQSYNTSGTYTVDILPPPPSITNISATDTSVSFRINNESTEAVEVYWAVKEGTTTVTQGGWISVAVNDFTTINATGLNTGTTYTIEAVARIIVGNASAADVESFNTILLPPTNIIADNIDISWTAATGADLYRVEAKDSIYSSYILVGTTTNTSIAWTPCDYTSQAPNSFVSFDVRVRSETTGNVVSNWEIVTDAYVTFC